MLFIFTLIHIQNIYFSYSNKRSEINSLTHNFFNTLQLKLNQLTNTTSLRHGFNRSSPLHYKEFLEFLRLFFEDESIDFKASKVFTEYKNRYFNVEKFLPLESKFLSEKRQGYLSEKFEKKRWNLFVSVTDLTNTNRKIEDKKILDFIDENQLLIKKFFQASMKYFEIFLNNMLKFFERYSPKLKEPKIWGNKDDINIDGDYLIEDSMKPEIEYIKFAIPFTYDHDFYIDLSQDHRNKKNTNIHFGCGKKYVYALERIRKYGENWLIEIYGMDIFSVDLNKLELKDFIKKSSEVLDYIFKPINEDKDLEDIQDERNENERNLNHANNINNKEKSKKRRKTSWLVVGSICFIFLICLFFCLKNTLYRSPKKKK